MGSGPDSVHTIAGGLHRVTAPNGGPMTFHGTNSYVLGQQDVVVIDPGPDDDAHLERILAAVPPGARVAAILVTHAHMDHTGGVAKLAAMTGAPIMAFGRAHDGRSALMSGLAKTLEIGGGEGVDHAFQPDVRLRHGQRIELAGEGIEVVHTPGHLSNHICFAVPKRNLVFTGDHVMGWSTTLISPPDGSISDFVASCELLAERAEATYLPGHGDPVEDGAAEARRQVAHRRMREGAVLDALQAGPSTIAGLTAQIYADVARHLHPAAARNVLAHLLDLTDRGRVSMPADDPLAGHYALARHQ